MQWLCSLVYWGWGYSVSSLIVYVRVPCEHEEEVLSRRSTLWFFPFWQRVTDSLLSFSPFHFSHFFDFSKQWRALITRRLHWRPRLSSLLHSASPSGSSPALVLTFSRVCFFFSLFFTSTFLTFDTHQSIVCITRGHRGRHGSFPSWFLSKTRHSTKPIPPFISPFCCAHFLYQASDGTWQFISWETLFTLPILSVHYFCN